MSEGITQMQLVESGVFEITFKMTRQQPFPDKTEMGGETDVSITQRENGEIQASVTREFFWGPNGPLRISVSAVAVWQGVSVEELGKKEVAVLVASPAITLITLVMAFITQTAMGSPIIVPPFVEEGDLHLGTAESTS